jgi:hypothetical protein
MALSMVPVRPESVWTMTSMDACESVMDMLILPALQGLLLQLRWHNPMFAALAEAPLST